MNIGVNCFGLKENFYRDGFEKTLENMKAMGVTSLEVTIDFPSNAAAMPKFPVELLGEDFPRILAAGIWPYDTCADKIASVRAQGLTVLSAHIMSFFSSPEEFLGLLPALLKFAKANEIHYLVFSPMKNAMEIGPWLAVYDRLSKALAAEGITLVLHNHEKECELIGDETALDVVFSSCPDIKLELDVGWAKFAGADPVALMEKYRDRLVFVHMKDITPDASPATRDTCCTAVGEGSIPVPEIIRKANELGIMRDGVIIDQDQSVNGMLRDIQTGVNAINAVEG